MVRLLLIIIREVIDFIFRYMSNSLGPIITESIYSSVFSPKKQSEFMNPDDVPYALDEAVQKLRATGLDPSLWATYIHIGV
jgi:hypothetical protein